MTRDGESSRPLLWSRFRELGMSLSEALEPKGRQTTNSLIVAGFNE